MKENGLKQYAKWIQAAFAAVLILFAALTLHDMQTAEGAGFYLAIKAGNQDRRVYDLLVDVIGMLCLLALLLLPCLLQKRLRPASFLRFASASLAFLPVMSMGALVHLADGSDRIELRQAILEGRLGEAFQEGIGGLLPILAAGVPVLILAFGMEKAGGGQSRVKGRAAWLRCLGISAVLLLALALLFPVLTDACAYLIVYLLLITAFSLWERLSEMYPRLDAWGWILFGGFWLRGIERMLEVMSVYHL
ncbi:hypothetical protein [Acetatifactor aquisgranensis]|uniref:hypothetical protein n=1 Tax=Acetatifactor aquisgranensis TaxID=2941233 RepID=UPI00203BA846|nr:hypothetical protein [Acetatifactor aquisgranensis]